jgi:predicted MFS family arabinose efflux permease
MSMATSPLGARWRALVLILSFVESFSTIVLERGIYFYSHERLHFTQNENLWLALGFGVFYIAGALASHRLARGLGERRALGACLGALLALHIAITWVPSGPMLVVGFALVGLLEGAKWPVVESYVAAGLGPREQLRAIGRFNLSWALAVPLALGLSGPLMALGGPRALFGITVLLNLVALALLPSLPRVAAHLEDSHPERPEPALLARYRRLLVSSRWSMLSSYALLFLLAPLMPGVFERLGRNVAEATLWASCLDAVRLLTFTLLGLWPAWRGRLAPLVVNAIGLPVGFAAVLFGSSLGIVVLGEVLFGVLSGITYFAALYYAMVVKNAAVDAGGAHEGLIGVGFALGPLVGLVGNALAQAGGSYLSGISFGVAPLLLACLWGAFWPLLQRPVRDARTLLPP